MLHETLCYDMSMNREFTSCVPESNSLTTDELGTSPEREPLPEVIIPKEIEEDLKDGVQKVLERIRMEKPDHIIVLQRSGSLAFTAVQEATKRRVIDLPPTYHILIGRKISDRHHPEEMSELIVDPDLLTNKQIDDYYEWLKRDAAAQKIVEEIQAVITPKPELIAQPSRVLFVDDALYQGVTLNLTVPLLTLHALHNLGVIQIEKATDYVNTKTIFQPPGIQEKTLVDIKLGDLFLSRSYLLNTFDWRGPILKETFGDLALPSGAERSVSLLLSELMRGSVKTEVHESKSIETWEDVEDIGRQIAEREGGENPAVVLEKIYEREQLLSLHQKTVEALQRVG